MNYIKAELKHPMLLMGFQNSPNTHKIYLQLPSGVKMQHFYLCFNVLPVIGNIRGGQ